MSVGIEKLGGGHYLVAGQKVRGLAKAEALQNQVSKDLAKRKVALMSELVDRLRFAATHGLQYEDARDIYKVGGYPTNITYQNYYDAYRRGGIAKRVVSIVSKTTWRLRPEISVDGKTDGTAFTDAWRKFVKEHDVFRVLERADRLGRIGQYAIVLIGTGDDDEAMKRPLGKGKVLYLTPYSQGSADIQKWIEDGSDPMYGFPELYNITTGKTSTGFKGTSMQVHHTRVIHVADERIEDDIYGQPALEPIWNDLQDLQKVSTSSAEAFWQNVTGILQALVELGNADEAFKMTDAELSALGTELEDFYHDLRHTFVGEGVKLERLAGQIHSPKDSADLCFTKIAAATGIPKRILFGSETGERASTEDQKTWYGQIAERQTTYAEPALLRPLIEKLIDMGVLPREGSEGYEVVWPPLFEESEKEIAEANRLRAEAAKALTPMGGNPLDLVEIDDERNIWMRPTVERTELTEKDLEAPEVQPTPIPGQEPAPDQKAA